MLKEIKEKIKFIKDSSSHMWANDSFSFYRFFIFVTSKKGQKRIWNFLYKLVRYFLRKLVGYKPKFDTDYAIWRHRNYPNAAKLEAFAHTAQTLAYQPKFSIIMPVYNTNAAFLDEAIKSVLNQVYTNWELCIADDASTSLETRNVLKEYESNAKIKIHYSNVNEHISLCSNKALTLATGEFVCFLDHDDLLAPHALFENAKLLNLNREAEIIYSDEDKINEHAKYEQPYFKPDWCPDSFLARNYLGHFVCIKSAIVKQIGGFRKGFEGAQDYDLWLRATEQTQKIFHIADVLYHWRMHSASTAVNEEAKPYAFNAGVKALEEALQRRQIKGKVSVISGLPGFYEIDYEVFNEGKVSVIIPTKNKEDLCEMALESIFSLTTYPNFEVILIDNNSDSSSFFAWVEKWKAKEPTRFIYVKDEGKFNFSRIMNAGAKMATGEYYLLLNNDTQVLNPEWMTKMVKQAQFKANGVIGSKLIFENNTIQHAGVIIGLGGIAGHTFVGFPRDASGYFHYLKCVNNYSALTAASCMVRKEVFLEVGGFNEELAVEFNDIDFCLKVKSKGYQNMYEPAAELYHFESISRGHPHKNKESFKQHVIDVNYFKNTWQHFIDHDPCYNKNLSLIFTDFRLNVKD
jgi:glycosyltransferase involved in cell wall biosynthesis